MMNRATKDSQIVPSRFAVLHDTRNVKIRSSLITATTVNRSTLLGSWSKDRLEAKRRMMRNQSR